METARAAEASSTTVSDLTVPGLSSGAVTASSAGCATWDLRWILPAGFVAFTAFGLATGEHWRDALAAALGT